MTLIEGNVFESVTTAITSASASAGGRIFNTYSSGSACSTGVGRTCVANSVTSTGSWSSYTDSSFFPNFSGKNVQSATSASSVKASVQANSGVGRIGN